MKKISYFKIGLFFIGGLLVGIGGLVWIGAAGIFQNTQMYATFFDHSISGLGVGSDVQYLGLKVGKISDISLVPDRKLVEVLMEIESEFEIDKQMAVQLKLSGITGKRHLSIIHPSGKVKFEPKKDLKVDYPVIPSVPGQFAKIEDTLENSFEKIQTIDFDELIRQWKKVAENANSVLSKEQIDKILANLTNVSERLETVTSSLEKKGTAEQWDQAFTDLAAAAQSSKAVSQNLEQQLEELPPGSISEVQNKMNSTLERIETATASTDQQVNDTLLMFRQTLQQTNRVLSEFQMLARSLRREPGRILTQPEEEEPFEK